MKEAFRMKVGEVRAVDSLEQPAVVVLKERQAFDAEAFAKEKAQTKQHLLRQKREQVFAQVSNDLRQRAEEQHQITINESLLAVL
jgi:hypothetical protein